jgi:hypothetical protein
MIASSSAVARPGETSLLPLISLNLAPRARRVRRSLPGCDVSDMSASWLDDLFVVEKRSLRRGRK